MFPGMNPKKIQAMMKQLGMSQKDVPAERVIIETAEKNIIINNPSVVKVNMQGQETFQISGDVSESASEQPSENSEDEETKENLEKDIETIMEKTNCKDKEQIALELEKNNGDIAKTIMDLNK